MPSYSLTQTSHNLGSNAENTANPTIGIEDHNNIGFVLGKLLRSGFDRISQWFHAETGATELNATPIENPTHEFDTQQNQESNPNFQISLYQSLYNSLTDTHDAVENYLERSEEQASTYHWSQPEIFYRQIDDIVRGPESINIGAEITAEILTFKQILTQHTLLNTLTAQIEQDDFIAARSTLYELQDLAHRTEQKLYIPFVYHGLKLDVKERLVDLPIIDLGANLGRTEYLDFIKDTDLNGPVARGVDSANRPFLTVCYQDNVDGQRYVETLFRRDLARNNDYYSLDSNWVSGGSRSYIHYSNKNSPNNNYLERLLNEEPAGIPSLFQSKKNLGKGVGDDSDISKRTLANGESRIGLCRYISFPAPTQIEMLEKNINGITYVDLEEHTNRLRDLCFEMIDHQRFQNAEIFQLYRTNEPQDLLPELVSKKQLTAIKELNSDWYEKYSVILEQKNAIAQLLHARYITIRLNKLDYYLTNNKKREALDLLDFHKKANIPTIESKEQEQHKSPGL